LIYFKNENAPVSPAQMERDPVKAGKLEALKCELRARHTISSFKGPSDLATQIVVDLHNHLAKKRTVPEGQTIQLGSKYQVNVVGSQGIVIGDHAEVTQGFADTKLKSPMQPSQSKPRLVRVKGESRVYLVDENGTRHWIPDGPTLESIARWEDVEPLASWSELEGFPPGRPIASIREGAKPWLVKVKGECEIYSVDEKEMRHRVDAVALASVKQQTDVDILVSWKELERFQPGEPIPGGTPG
jgi:hypothetical protein